jgi:hypothetical protein
LDGNNDKSAGGVRVIALRNDTITDERDNVYDAAFTPLNVNMMVALRDVVMG